MYPFTCAGMFAYQVTPDTPRYVFQMTGSYADSDVPRQMDFREAGAHPRNFFTYVYGSASSNTTHHHFPDDTPEQFAQRLSVWFAGYTRAGKTNTPTSPYQPRSRSGCRRSIPKSLNPSR